MSLSIVIPTYTISEELEDISVTCALSFRKHVDELIIVEDGGMFSKELQEVADIYVYNKQNVGYVKNVNKGWKLSTGDYTILGNSDTYLMEGNPKDLCVKGAVTCPKMSGYNVEYLCGAFFCVPSEVQKEHGYLNEEYINYGADSEYEQKILPILKMISTVDVLHFGAKTTSEAKIKHP